MIFDSDGTTTTVYQEKGSLENFLINLKKEYPKIKNDNIIVNLFSFKKLTANDILEFLQLAELQKNAKKSFVLVTDNVMYDQIPEAICVVPTLLEAMDVIEMEEIERDLEL